ncbi:hypothetical protein QUA82_34155 [Microcoleus sp. F8-D3]
MRIKAIQGTKGIETERKNATYVEAAGVGKVSVVAVCSGADDRSLCLDGRR